MNPNRILDQKGDQRCCKPKCKGVLWTLRQSRLEGYLHVYRRRCDVCSAVFIFRPENTESFS